MTAARASHEVTPTTTTTALRKVRGGPHNTVRRADLPAATGSDATTALLQLHRAANAVRHHVEQAVLRPQNLTWTGFVVLRAVWAARRIETRHAAEEAGISKATLTGVVDTLVTRGLVRRVSHAGDGRLVVLELTRRGQRLVRELVPAAQDEEAFALSCLKPGQLDTVTTALRSLVDHLDEDTARSRR